MHFKVFSAAINGLNAQIIEVETDVSFGLSKFEIVGLPDKTVEESKERVAAAIKNTGFRSPFQQSQKVLINLAPANLRKEGSLYDLPIALGYLFASKQIRFNPQEKIFCAELALNGQLRPIRGVLSLSLIAKEKGYKEIILAKENAPEAALALSLEKNKNTNQEIKIIGLNSLKEVINYLEGRLKVAPFKIDIDNYIKNPEYSVDIGWIKGQESAKRALEISAAGGHNLMMQGPPGTGKSLLASALPSILPDLSLEEVLEVTKIYSIAGLLPKNKPIINRRPFRSPHHTSSEASLIGGGNPPRPGEITLAHRGILFLDEFPEFHRDVLESLRQPLEEGKINILRSRYHLTFPAKFTLVTAANPCPCGHLNNPKIPCTCTASQIASYRRKLSGPIIDRIDILIEVPQVEFEKLVSEEKESLSKDIKERVKKAREIQLERFFYFNKRLKNNESKIFTNAEMKIPQIKEYCPIDEKSNFLLKKYVDSGKLSGRGYHRVLKISRTIADLEGEEKIKFDHIAEALNYRINKINQNL